VAIPSVQTSSGGNYTVVVTNSAGVKSIDTVTVTIGSNLKAAYVAPPVLGTSGASSLAHPIQDAIDAAKAGDLIIVDAGNYSELVIMDRPVRLQGVGAAATVINATKYPNQKVDQWRTRINNLFGLDNQGNALPGPAGTNPAVDPLPGQEITGGVVLLEPSVLGTEEGAGITVVAKGLRDNGQPLRNNNTESTFKGKGMALINLVGIGFSMPCRKGMLLSLDALIATPSRINLFIRIEESPAE